MCVCAGWYLQHVFLWGGFCHRRQRRLCPTVGRRLQADHQDRPARGWTGIQRYENTVTTSVRQKRTVSTNKSNVKPHITMLSEGSQAFSVASFNLSIRTNTGMSLQTMFSSYLGLGHSGLKFNRVFQLLLWKPEVFPGQVRYVILFIPPASSGPILGSPRGPSWRCPEEALNEGILI